MRTTHTFVELEVSAASYDEIAGKLRDAGYSHAFIDQTIDMHGIGLTRGPEPVETKAHMWERSQLGHGELMCARCKITVMEARALGEENTCNG